MELQNLFLGRLLTRLRAPLASSGDDCSALPNFITVVRVYREIRHHFGDPDGLGRSIQATAQALNQELFSEPLPVAEVDQIARSIHRWIITESRMWADGAAVYDATFTAIQAARGRKGGKKSGLMRRNEKRQDTFNLIEAGKHA